MHRRELNSTGKQEALQQRRCAVVMRNSAKHGDISITGRARGTSALRQGE